MPEQQRGLRVATHKLTEPQWRAAMRRLHPFAGSKRHGSKVPLQLRAERRHLRAKAARRARRAAR